MRMMSPRLVKSIDAALAELQHDNKVKPVDNSWELA